MKFRTILADPPWAQTMMPVFARRPMMAARLPYSTLSVEEIKRMPVGDFAADGCHLWLWTTNQFLRAGFEVMEAWGFKYLAPIHWIKPSGCGIWFVHRSQTLLFGYRSPLKMKRKCLPNVLAANPRKHSQKPPDFYRMIESVSRGSRLEIFARNTRPGWKVFGNEVKSDITLEDP